MKIKLVSKYSILQNKHPRKSDKNFRGLVTKNISQAMKGLMRQCLKWRSPVKSITMPHSSAFLIESASRTLPPGCAMALTPYESAKVTQSSNGKKASEPITRPISRTSRPRSRHVASACFRAIRSGSSGLPRLPMSRRPSRPLSHST